MNENTSFTIKTVEMSADGRYGKFECGPLERGYGITLGNSLRRVLLSSLTTVWRLRLSILMEWNMNFPLYPVYGKT